MFQRFPELRGASFNEPPPCVDRHRQASVRKTPMDFSESIASTGKGAVFSPCGRYLAHTKEFSLTLHTILYMVISSRGRAPDTFLLREGILNFPTLRVIQSRDATPHVVGRGRSSGSCHPIAVAIYGDRVL